MSRVYQCLSDLFSLFLVLYKFSTITKIIAVTLFKIYFDWIKSNTSKSYPVSSLHFQTTITNLLQVFVKVFITYNIEISMDFT